jgi:signal transduction histidine kinase
MLESYNKEHFNLMFSEIFGYVLLFNLLIVPIHFLIALVISKAYYKLLSQHKRHEAIMIQQSKMAAIGEMISFIAHQWRQPLNRLASLLMRTRIETEQSTLDRESLVENFNAQEHLLEHLSETIESFRDFYKPDKSFSTFSLNSSVEQVLELFSPTLKEGGITYTYKECSDTIIKGRKNEFMQVILTLINNAAYILHERAVKNPNINITTLKKGSYIHIIIDDNGGGIKVKPLKKIFRPYFSKNNNNKSSGMGLYISKLIIEDHFHGTLQAQNITNGARFTIEVPVDT